MTHEDGIHALNGYDDRLPEFNQMRREGVLFIYRDKPSCFWPPKIRTADMLGYVVIWAVLYGIATLTMFNDGVGRCRADPTPLLPLDSANRRTR